VVSSTKNRRTLVDPYFYKTLVEEYFSKTLCRKDATDTEVQKALDLLSKMEGHCLKVEQIDF
jgi:uncharacterized HAD superfamily protein